MITLEKGVYPLKGVVQDYAWGGNSFIPKLIGIENPDQLPFAEYWIGTHNRGAAKINVNEGWKDLRESVQLPFLLKVLDVNGMLSIQSHPNKGQAEIGFARENDLNIPLDARHRVFKDDNHKPELMLALSDFWLLHGFRSIESINQIIEESSSLRSAFANKLTDLKKFYTYLMTFPEAEKDKVLTDLKAELSINDTLDENQAGYWAKLALEKYGLDRGIFSIYFFNLVHLKPGEAIYQEAGIPHAYLRGQNVEIMANSDNVFRAGLTPKHIDKDLLIEHLVFSEVTPKIIRGTKSNPHEEAFISPAKEFELRQINLNSAENMSFTASTSECLLILEGELSVTSNGLDQRIHKGQACYITAQAEVGINCHQKCRIIRAITPS